jgi:hypothetical protein
MPEKEVEKGKEEEKKKGKVIIYLELNDYSPQLDKPKTQVNNERIFDILNSDMTRSRTLDDLDGTLP